MPLQFRSPFPVPGSRSDVLRNVSAVRSLILFHLSGGARVAARNAIATICAVIIILGSAPDPWVWLRFLALGLAGAGFGSGPLVGLTVLAYALARDAVPRLTLGLGGWTRSLNVTGAHHRRGVVFGLPIIQLPLLAAVLLAAGLTVTVYRVPLSWPKLLGAVVAVIAAGATAVPSRRWPIALPLFGASMLLASLGRWDTLAASVALFALGDLVAGALRFPPPRAGVPSPAAPGTLRMFRFTWRALGWRLLAPAPLAAFALAAAWFYTRNNELGPADTAFVARLWGVIAVALSVGAVGDAVASRRPSWPWIRSLPWSSRERAIDDAIAVGAPAILVGFAFAAVELRTVVIVLASIAPLASVAVSLLHTARRRLTRVSGPLIIVGAGFATAVAFWPWMIVAAVAATPWLIRRAARHDRREVVTGWKELHHDAAGDSLAWSTR